MEDIKNTIKSNEEEIKKLGIELENEVTTEQKNILLEKNTLIIDKIQLTDILYKFNLEEKTQAKLQYKHIKRKKMEEISDEENSNKSDSHNDIVYLKNIQVKIIAKKN